MFITTITDNFLRSSSTEIAILGILIVLLNLRALAATSKAKFLVQFKDYLLIGIIPTLVISVLIIINQLIAAIALNN